MKPKSCNVTIKNSNVSELDGKYELTFLMNKHYTVCILRQDKQFCNPVSGVAIVHPKEKPDEVIGCKTALVRAVQSFLNNSPIEMKRYLIRKFKDTNTIRGRFTTQLINAWQKEMKL